MRVIDEKVTDFLTTLNLGIEWIGDAGKKLVGMLDENPDAVEDILEASSSPWITREVLQTIEAIGRGQIAPEMLVLPIHVLNRLATLPTEDQIKAMQGVEVIVPSRNGKGGYHKCVKPACRLTKAEAVRSIGPQGLIPVSQQIVRDQSACVLGKYQLVMEKGEEPKLQRVFATRVPDYQKQRIKLTNGVALIELYL